ncbi:tyrosine-type recombinase/integrase [Sinorhizobium meliloti]
MLSDAKARKMKPGDKPISDGAVRGLYLFPSATPGSGKWVLRFVSPLTGKRRDMGLGSYSAVSIRDARARALEARTLIENGGDPLEERRQREDDAKKLAKIPTFEEAARRHHADRAEGFRNKKHIDQWINTLDQYVFPRIGKRPVNELGPADFAACLKPIWLEKPETASRIKQRCDAGDGLVCGQRPYPGEPSPSGGQTASQAAGQKGARRTPTRIAVAITAGFLSRRPACWPTQHHQSHAGAPYPDGLQVR